MSAHRLLAENKVTGIAVGDQIYKCPTIKVRIIKLSQVIVSFSAILLPAIYSDCMCHLLVSCSKQCTDRAVSS